MTFLLQHYYNLVHLNVLPIPRFVCLFYFLGVCRWVLGLDKAHVASAPRHLRLPWKLSLGHAFISDGGFPSARQAFMSNASCHRGQKAERGAGFPQPCSQIFNFYLHSSPCQNPKGFNRTYLF